MKPVKDLLARFKNLHAPDEAVRRVVAEAVKNIARIPVTVKDIRMQNSIAFVNCSSIARSVIKSSRAGIMAAIARELPRAGALVRDVR